jgi:ubiquitin carboxyl-terminal hydrolase 25/28
MVTIKIYSPRLTKTLLSNVLDTATVYKRGQREIAKDPERHHDSKPVAPYQALGFLRLYLTNARAPSDPNQSRRIARRNKKYMLAFADECNALFEYLDFVAEQEEAEGDVSTI